MFSFIFLLKKKTKNNSPKRYNGDVIMLKKKKNGSYAGTITTLGRSANVSTI